MPTFNRVPDSFERQISDTASLFLSGRQINSQVIVHHYVLVIYGSMGGTKLAQPIVGIGG